MTLCVVKLGWIFGCAVAKGWAGVEAYVRHAGLCEDDPGVFAFFMLEVGDCTHIASPGWECDVKYQERIFGRFGRTSKTRMLLLFCKGLRFGGVEEVCFWQCH